MPVRAVFRCPDEPSGASNENADKLEVVTAETVTTKP
jgi:hypothetical protein